MRRAVVAVAFTACGFEAGSPSGDAPASAQRPSEYCGPTSGAAANHVMVCFEFEDTADDGSSHHLTAHTRDLSFVTGTAGKAMSFAATSAADVDDAAIFDVASLTIEMWIDPPALPGNTVYLLDVNDQYALQLKDNGDLRCTLVGGRSLDATADIQAGRWTHVACTYDAATGHSTIFVGGTEINSDNAGANHPLDTKGTTGLSLAADNPPTAGARGRMIGLVDQVRLLDYARSAADLCTDSGRTTCQ